MDLGAAATVAACVGTAAVTWLIATVKQGKDVEFVNTTLSLHTNRLDQHQDKLEEIQRDFVSRREFDEKLKLYFDPLTRQMDQQTRMLEFAVFGKIPDPQSLQPK